MSGHTTRLVERHEITDDAVYRTDMVPVSEGYLDTEGGSERDHWYAQAARPMLDQAYAWAAHRGIEIEPNISVRHENGYQTFALHVVWEVEVGRAEDDAWSWSAYYEEVAGVMPA